MILSPKWQQTYEEALQAMKDPIFPCGCIYSPSYRGTVRSRAP